MSNRPTFPIAVHLLITHRDDILLLRRFNTGWADGDYSLVAGHVEHAESATQAIVREANEEIDVELLQANLVFEHCMHRIKETGEERFDLFFRCNEYAGSAYNAEPNKCDEVKWFRKTDLPINMVGYVRAAIAAIHQGKKYSEFGWE